MEATLVKPTNNLQGANMVEPTNGMYNTLCSGLNLSNQTFQMIQGVLPVQSRAQDLYNYFDGIPPQSVAVLYEGNPLNTLSGNYGTMLSKTEDTNTFLYKIALGNFVNTENWIGGNIGVNPIYAPPFEDLMAQVRKGSSAQIQFDSETANTNISDSWAKSDGSSGVGFWGTKENSVSEELNQKASSSRITVNIELQNYAYMAIRAGGWFYSGYFTDMYQNPDQFVGGQEEWDNLFGTSGSLQRVTTQALLVAGYKIEVRSWASYTEDDYKKIQESSETNVWPFYTSGSSSTTTSTYHLNDDKSISVFITSDPDNLQIMGMGVIPTDVAVTGGSADHNVKAPSRLV